MRTYHLAGLVSALLITGCVSQSQYDHDLGLERQLNEQLSTEVQADQIEIQHLHDRLRVTVEEKILYPEGAADLTPKGKAILDKLTPTLKQASDDHRIEIEGYTDDVPIGKHLKKQYKSNWELSAARAAGVVEYLQKKGVDPARMSASGHGQYQPKATDKSEDARAINRRTEIDLVPVYEEQDQK